MSTKFTFDEICDSQNFNHDEEFVLASNMDSLEKELTKYKAAYEVLNGYMLIVKQYSDENDYVLEKIDEAAKKVEEIMSGIN